MNPIFVVMQFHIVDERAKPFLRSNIAREALELTFFSWDSLFCRSCQTLAWNVGQFLLRNHPRGGQQAVNLIPIATHSVSFSDQAICRS